MKRSKPLQADPAKTAAWQQRGRARAAENARQRPRQPLSQGKRRQKARIPQPIRAAVLRRQGGKCITPGCKGRPAHRHHCLDEQMFPQAACEPGNLVAICPACHDNHTRAHRRLRREWLPPGLGALAVSIGPRAVSFLERTYPHSGAAPGGTGLREEQQHG